MTEVQDTTDRKAKQLRRTARILALAWASLSTLLLVSAPPVAEFIEGASAVEGARQAEPLSRLTVFGSAVWPVVALFALTSWIAAAIAWRWWALGAVLLVVAASVQLIAYPTLLIREPAPWCVPICLPLTFPVALPGFIAAFLLLLSSRSSRLPKPDATASEGGDGGG